MFDLNEAVTSWRAGLAGQPNVEAADLDELEDHLREEVAGLTAAGLNEEEAFLVAARRLGRPEDLNSEFAIADPRGRRRFRLSWMILGALTLLLMWLASEVLGNFAAGTVGHFTLFPGGLVGPLGLGWVGGLTRLLILIVGGVIVWRLLSRDTGARRVTSMGAGTFFVLALVLVLLAFATRLGSTRFLLFTMPHDVFVSTSVVLAYFRMAMMLILPLLLLVGLWKLIAGRR